MQINFDTKTMTIEEAMGLSELLIALQPEVIDNLLMRYGDNTPSKITGTEEIRVASASHEHYVQSIERETHITSPHNKLTTMPDDDAAPDAVKLDNGGLPWDVRIHSESRMKTADGSWKKRRGVAAELVAQVEAELKLLMAVPQQDVAAPTPEQAFAPAIFVPIVQVAPPPPQAIAPTTNEMPPIPAFLDRSQQAAPAPPPPQPIAQAPVAPPVAPAHGATPQEIYIGLVGRASAAVQNGRITQEEIAAACTKFGVPALPLVVNRPDLLGAIANEIDALIARVR